MASTDGAGEIELILGPMFSGKTTELLRRVRRHKAAARRCFLVSYQGDVRYGSGGNITTHDLTDMPSHPVMRLEQVDNAAYHHDVIAIDEGQFMPGDVPDVTEYAERWASAGKLVIIAALDGTYQRKPFPVVVALVPLAEHISKLTAVCMSCHRGASFTWRTAPETEVEMVGGADSYQALCRSCHANAVQAQEAAAAAASTAAAVNTPVRNARAQSTSRRVTRSSRNLANDPALALAAASLSPKEKRRRSLQALTLR